SLADHHRWTGSTVEVLVEGPSKKALDADDLPQLTGRTMTDHIVVFDGPERLTGRTVRVHIDDATAFTLFGTVEASELVGVACDAGEPGASAPGDRPRRFGLPLV